jgi:ketosteroid isomerase-like protein
MVENLNRQRVLNFLEVFNAGDIEAALSRCSDYVEFFTNAPVDILPHMGHHRGKDELRKMWTTVHTSYSSLRYEVPMIVADDERVAVNICAFFRKSTNSRIAQFDIAAFYTLREGRITHISRDHRYVRPRAAGGRARPRRAVDGKAAGGRLTR